MTTLSAGPSGGASAPVVELVTVTIDGVQVSVPKGTLVIRAAELIGVEIPRFCDHPLLDPVGACRQCMVEIEGQRKPFTSCTTVCTEGMVVHTQLTSAAAEKAQRGVMELLLINHPLDCPVCDKGGECPLQNQSMSAGSATSRFDGVKRTYPKPVPVSSQILLDRERCVLCARCTRFAQQIAGDPFIELFERGALEQVAIGQGAPFHSYFSGNVIQICPVGALTSAAYRFRSRPFDLVSSPGVCEHCSSGCAIRTDHRRGKLMRRLAGNDPQVNEEWLCDKGRFAFRYAQLGDRLTTPLVRDAETGELEVASWPEALHTAAAGLLAAGGGTGVLTGGRLTVEDAYAYAKFARVALSTNDVDFRARVHSAEEATFLAAEVAGRGLTGLDGTEREAGAVTHAALEQAPAVLLVDLEVEDEAPNVFLRLRKAYRKNGLKLFAIAPYATRGLVKLGGTLLPTVPGGEPHLLDTIAGRQAAASGVDHVFAALRSPGAVILVGERVAGVAGALTAAMRLSTATGAQLAWIPRRAGERGAVEVGALPSLLPAGRQVTDLTARDEVAAVWGAGELPGEIGRDTGQILAAAADGSLGALVVGGVDIADLPDVAAAERALAQVGFLVSLEQRMSAVTARANVVLPVAAVMEKAGTYLNWEGRWRAFEVAIKPDQAVSTSFPSVRHTLPDLRVLNMLGEAMASIAGPERRLNLPDVDAARAELASLAPRRRGFADPPTQTSRPVPEPEAGQAILAGHHLLLDGGRLQDGDPALAATRPRPVARLSAATAAEVGVADGEPLAVTGPAGSRRLPLEITEMPDRVVWLPLRWSQGLDAGRGGPAELGAVPGAVVTLAPGAPQEAASIEEGR